MRSRKLLLKFEVFKAKGIQMHSAERKFEASVLQETTIQKNQQPCWTYSPYFTRTSALRHEQTLNMN
jgi:hypothetical protein